MESSFCCKPNPAILGQFMGHWPAVAPPAGKKKQKRCLQNKKNFSFRQPPGPPGQSLLPPVILNVDYLLTSCTSYLAPWTRPKCLRDHWRGRRERRRGGEGGIRFSEEKNERKRNLVLWFRLQFCASRFSLLWHMEYSARQWWCSAWNALSAMLPPLWEAAQG